MFVDLISSKVNDINFENMSNDDAVRVLREIVHKPGWVPVSWLDSPDMKWGIIMIVSPRPIILTVAKCWDPSPQGYFTLPRSECTATFFFPSVAKCGSLTFSMFCPPLQMNRSDPSTQQRGWVTLWQWPGPTRRSQAAPPSALSPPPPLWPRRNVRGLLLVFQIGLNVDSLNSFPLIFSQVSTTSTYPCTLTWLQLPRLWPHQSRVWRSGIACGSKSPSLMLFLVRLQSRNGGGLLQRCYAVFIKIAWLVGGAKVQPWLSVLTQNF